MTNPMLLSPKQISQNYKAHLMEADSIEKIDPQYDILQLKYDGWWVVVKILGNLAQVITSGGEVRKTYPIENPNGVEALLIGEWMYGTNWSGTFNPGAIFIHDLIWWDHPSEIFMLFDGEGKPYRLRLKELEFQNKHNQLYKFGLKLVVTYPIEALADLWISYPNFEGIVLKDSNCGLGGDMVGCKIKRSFTEDYVVMNITEGAGRLQGKMGSIEGGLYVNDKLTSICAVGGGFTDGERLHIWNNQGDLIGKVFEAQGKAKFKGGALRHPVFLRWREDKLAKQCVRNDE